MRGRKGHWALRIGLFPTGFDAALLGVTDFKKKKERSRAWIPTVTEISRIKEGIFVFKSELK